MAGPPPLRAHHETKVTIVSQDRWNVELGQGLGEIKLELAQSEVLRRLEEAEIEFDAEEGDREAFCPDMDMVLTFSQTHPPVLLQIAVRDDQLHFGSHDVIGRKLHEITSLLQVREEETVWRTEEEPADSLPTTAPADLSPVSDEELLERGTLWIKPFGLGLRLWRGNIQEVILRIPQNSPAVGVAKLTAKQLELSQRADLSIHLQGANRPTTRGWFRTLSGLICFGLIFGIVWLGMQYQRRWNDAPTVEAQVVAIRPNAPDQIATEFDVRYSDQNGVEHHATVGLADVIVPKAVGDTVELRYLPDNPDQPLGLGRVHDAAFVKFFPWAIGVFAGYLVLQVVAAGVRKLLFVPTERPVS